MRHVATHGHNGYFGCEREGCKNLPAVHGTHTRCRCEGWQTQNKGLCTACNSPVLADWEWELLTDNVHWANSCLGDGFNSYGMECPGYARSEWPCSVCSDRQASEVQNSAGFVETETDNFPLTLIAHRGDKTIPVLHVRADSITAVESKTKGYVDILFEIYGSDITGTIPMVDYFTTEGDV